MVREKKKSWKEIDRKRDRNRGAGHRKDERSNLERALEDPRMKERYLQEAEKLFMGAKGRPEHSKDLMAIHESYGSTRFLSTVRHYVDTYGMPNDWGALLLILDIKNDSELVCKAIENLCELVGEKGTVERRGLESKLRVLSLTARDTEIRETAKIQLTELS
ncbi:MAG: hypothetical protein EHM49_09230 [Deltaproteobacteria bacterium]|nr:MAG: hypothetical protein EHM49_09230 [Deltaproteobacteria bacterium]